MLTKLKLIVISIICGAIGSLADHWNPSNCPKQCHCSLANSEWFLQNNLRTIDCANRNLTEFPVNLPLDVQILLLDNNDLNHLFDHDDQPIYLHDLIHLDLSNNKIESLGSDSQFREFYNMQILDLSNNRLTTLADYTFAGLFNLERLALSNNYIQNGIGDQTFHGLLKLQTLEMSANRIEYVQPNWWSNANLHNLREIRLDNNFLSFLQTDTFDNLPSLRRLDLNGNKLQRLHKNAFRGLQSLQVLNLDYNLLAEVPKEALSKLKRSLNSLNMNHNPLKSLKANDFVDFPHLKDASFNYMPRLTVVEKSTFKNIPELLIVDLHDNPHLSYIDPWAFLKTNEITHLFLHNNNLSSIPHTLLQNLRNLSELSFYGNPLACDCNSKFLRRILDNQSLKIRDVDRMICNSPFEHKFKLFTSLKSEDLPQKCQPQIVATLVDDRNKIFDCRAIGEPRPKIFWLSPDNQILEAKNSGESLILEHDAPSGRYTCLAENDMGRATARIEFFREENKPNLELKASHVTDRSAQIAWTIDNERDDFELDDLKLIFRTEESSTSLDLDQIQPLTKFPSKKSYQIKHLKPDTTYEICLTWDKREEIFSCVEFRTKISSSATETNIFFDKEKIGNLAIMVTLTVMAFVLVCLLIVVVILKKRRPRLYGNLCSSHFQGCNYVATPQDCKSFLFDSVPPTPRTPCNVYVNPTDDRSAFGAFYGSKPNINL